MNRALVWFYQCAELSVSTAGLQIRVLDSGFHA